MSTIRVVGVLVDPLGLPVYKAKIRLTALATSPDVVESSFKNYTTNAIGEYDFEVFFGYYKLEVLVDNEYNILNEIVISGATPSVITLPDLVNYSEAITPPDIVEGSPLWEDILTDFKEDLGTDSIVNVTQISTIESATGTVDKIFTNHATQEYGAESVKQTVTGDSSTTDKQFSYRDVSNGNQYSSKTETSTADNTEVLTHKESGKASDGTQTSLTTEQLTTEVIAKAETVSIVGEDYTEEESVLVDSVTDEGSIQTSKSKRLNRDVDSLIINEEDSFLQSYINEALAVIDEPSIISTKATTINTDVHSSKLIAKDVIEVDEIRVPTAVKTHSSITNEKEAHIKATTTPNSSEISLSAELVKVPNKNGDTILSVVPETGTVNIQGTLVINGQEDFTGPPGDTVFEVFEYSVDNADWHTDFVTGDIYRRHNVSVNGVVDPLGWSDGYKIVGEDGQTGDSVYIEYQYADEGLTWHDTLVTGDVYRRERVITDGSPSGPGAPPEYWSTPARITGIDGVNGYTVGVLIQYSIDGLDPWHENFASGDHYRRELDYKYPATYDSLEDAILADEVTYGIWSTPAKISPEEGVDYGYKYAMVPLYKTGQIKPDPPTNVEYNFLTLEVTGDLDGWVKEIPNSTEQVYIALGAAYSIGDTAPIPSWEVTLYMSSGSSGAGFYSITVPSTNQPDFPIEWGPLVTADFQTEFGRDPMNGDYLSYVSPTATEKDEFEVESRVYDDSSWVDPALIVDGAIIAKGSITAESITASTITGDVISASTTIIAGSESSTAGMNGDDSLKVTYTDFNDIYDPQEHPQVPGGINNYIVTTQGEIDIDTAPYSRTQTSIMFRDYSGNIMHDDPITGGSLILSYLGESTPEIFWDDDPAVIIEKFNETSTIQSAGGVALLYVAGGLSNFIMNWADDLPHPLVEVSNTILDRNGFATTLEMNNSIDYIPISYVADQDKVEKIEGIAWEVQDIPDPNAVAADWRGIAYGNGLFVAVGIGGTHRIMTSPDGENWTLRTAPVDNAWLAVTYGGGQFVATAGSGTDRVMTSPDGITWTMRPAVAGYNTWDSIVYGNGMYVALASGGSASIMTSPDGITWTERTNPESHKWSSIAYGNSLFVAVADSGTNRIMTSSDGITWASMAAPESLPVWTGITFGNGMFVAVAQGNGSKIMTSADGLIWEMQHAQGYNMYGPSITYGNGVFVVVTAQGVNQSMISLDGILWVPRETLPTDNNLWYWNSLCHGNGKFIAVADYQGSQIMTTSDIVLPALVPADGLYGQIYGEFVYDIVTGNYVTEASNTPLIARNGNFYAVGDVLTLTLPQPITPILGTPTKMQVVIQRVEDSNQVFLPIEKSVRFWAGAEDPSEANFAVTSEGDLIANNVQISGRIRADVLEANTGAGRIDNTGIYGTYIEGAYIYGAIIVVSNQVLATGEFYYDGTKIVAAPTLTFPTKTVGNQVYFKNSVSGQTYTIGDTTLTIKGSRNTTGYVGGSGVQSENDNEALLEINSHRYITNDPWAFTSYYKTPLDFYGWCIKYAAVRDFYSFYYGTDRAGPGMILYLDIYDADDDSLLEATSIEIAYRGSISYAIPTTKRDIIVAGLALSIEAEIDPANSKKANFYLGPTPGEFEYPLKPDGTHRNYRIQSKMFAVTSRKNPQGSYNSYANWSLTVNTTIVEKADNISRLGFLP